jgi:hypothetical protein
MSNLAWLRGSLVVASIALAACAAHVDDGDGNAQDQEQGDSSATAQGGATSVNTGQGGSSASSQGTGGYVGEDFGPKTLAYPHTTYPSTTDATVGTSVTVTTGGGPSVTDGITIQLSNAPITCGDHDSTWNCTGANGRRDDVWINVPEDHLVVGATYTLEELDATYGESGTGAAGNCYGGGGSFYGGVISLDEIAPDHVSFTMTGSGDGADLAWDGIYVAPRCN